MKRERERERERSKIGRAINARKRPKKRRKRGVAEVDQTKELRERESCSGGRCA
jgi:hypothetical protein